MEHEAWMQHITNGDSLRSIARHINVSPSTISRQIERNGVLSAENVIAIARAYDANVVDALIDTDYIRHDEISIIGISPALANATNSQLLDEFKRRVDPEARRMFHGDDDDITPDFGMVHRITPGVHPVSEYEGVADSSPDHEEEDSDFD